MMPSQHVNIKLAVLCLISLLSPIAVSQATIVGTLRSQVGPASCFGTLPTNWIEPASCSKLTIGYPTDPIAHTRIFEEHWVFRGGHTFFSDQSHSCNPPRTTDSSVFNYIVPVYYTASSYGCPGTWSMALVTSANDGVITGSCCPQGFAIPKSFPLCVSTADAACGDWQAAAYVTGQPGQPTMVIRSTPIEYQYCAASGFPIEVRWPEKIDVVITTPPVTTTSTTTSTSIPITDSQEGPVGGIASSTSRTASRSTTTSPASGGGSGGGGSGQISKSTQIAIGTAIPAGALLVLGILFLLWRRRRQRSTAVKSDVVSPEPYTSSSPAGWPPQEKIPDPAPVQGDGGQPQWELSTAGHEVPPPTSPPQNVEYSSFGYVPPPPFITRSSSQTTEYNNLGYVPAPLAIARPSPEKAESVNSGHSSPPPSTAPRTIRSDNLGYAAPSQSTPPPSIISQVAEPNNSAYSTPPPTTAPQRLGHNKLGYAPPPIPASIPTTTTQAARSNNSGYSNPSLNTIPQRAGHNKLGYARQPPTTIPQTAGFNRLGYAPPAAQAAGPSTLGYPPQAQQSAPSTNSGGSLNDSPAPSRQSPQPFSNQSPFSNQFIGSPAPGPWQSGRR